MIDGNNINTRYSDANDVYKLCHSKALNPDMIAVMCSDRVGSVQLN